MLLLPYLFAVCCRWVCAYAEIVLGPAPSVTYRTIGGLLDFYLIFGDNAETVTMRYTEVSITALGLLA